MTKTKLKEWFSKNGRVHTVHSDPRGRYYVSGYLDEIYKMVEKQLKKGAK